MTVHILLHGYPLCMFSTEFPKDWPAENKWIGLDQKELATCDACKEKAKEIEEQKNEKK